MENKPTNTESPQDLEPTVDGSLETVLELLKEYNEDASPTLVKDIVLILDTSNSERNAFEHYILGNVSGSKMLKAQHDHFSDPSEIRNDSTRNSRLPRKMHDNDTDTTFYYVPFGFTGSVQEITSKYFIKKVVESAKSIKLLLMVSYSYILNERQDLVPLVERLSRFIKDIGKFNNSVALLATDVEIGNEKANPVSDRQLVGNIVHHMIGVQQKFNNTGSNEQIFTDSLLTEINFEFVKIGIFRRPDEFSDAHSLKKEKHKLIKIVKESIHFAKVDVGSFDYTVSLKYQKRVRDWITEIGEKISRMLFDFSGTIENHYSLLETKLHDVDMLRTMFKSITQRLSKISENMEPKYYVEEIFNSFDDLPVTIPSASISKILNLIDFLEFINLLIGTTPCRGDICFRENLGFKHYLYHSERWYAFLSYLVRRLSEYDVQNDVSRFNITTFEYPPEKESRKIKFREINWSLEFLEQFSSLDEVEAYADIGNININPAKLNALNNVLNTSLNYKVNVSCSSSNGLTLTGNYLRLSRVNNTKMDACSEKNFTSIRLFSLRKIFIDSEFDATGDGLELTIIAPRWEIMGNRKITLDGKAGAESVEFNRGSGKPGMPGGPGGYFLGIGTTFINGQGLFISSNGGIGGPGQEGGVGAGADLKFCNSYNGFYALVFSNNSNGGDGGAGGIGGFKGKITLIELNNKVKPSVPPGNICNEDGPVGKEGKGGSGGNSQIVKPSCMNDPEITKLKHRSIQQYLSITAAKPGISGVVKENIKYPLKLTFGSATGSINEFKNAMKDFLDSDPRKELSMKFLNDLDNDEQIVRLYNTRGLVEELKDVEQRFHAVQNRRSILPIYHSLLKRISIYAMNPNESERSEEYRKVLSYLYTTALSKISLINSGSESDLVIDVASYLDLMGISIAKLKESLLETAKNEFDTKYKDKINRKIKEAESYIAFALLPEKEMAIHEIDQEIESLIQQAIDLQNIAQKSIHLLRKVRKKLKKKLLLRKIVSSVKMVGSILNIFGPVGSLVSKAISGGAAITERYLDGKKMKDIMSKIPMDVHNALQAVLKYEQDNLDDLKEKMGYLSSMVKGIPKQYNDSELQELQKKIFEARDIIFKEVAKPSAFRNDTYIECLRVYLKDEIYKQEKRLGNQVTLGRNQYAIPLEIVNHMNAILEISSDLYSAIRNHKEHIDEVNKQIAEAKQSIRELKRSEQIIHQILQPSYDSIKRFIGDLERSLKDGTRVTLEFKKWKVQSILKDLKFEMKKWTNWYGGEEKLLHSIYKLQDTITTVINMYDIIERFREEAELYGFISHIGSTTMMSITISDQQLKNSVNDLEFIIKSNIVLSQYEKALSAFKQYVFPFAQSHLIELPSSLDTDNLISNAVARIQTLKTKIDETSVTISKYDKYIHPLVKYRREDGGKPFYVWSYDTNKEAIVKILEGKEVSMSADVTRNNEYNAVKFNAIGIKFRCTNETVQKELDKQLRHFEVIMIHSGNSYYRCGDKYYTISSDAQTVKFSFRKDAKGEPVNKNMVYKKISLNNPILSPYTVWTIKLFNRTGDFSLLRKFENQTINLELEGKGQYIARGLFDREVCNQDLERYYTKYDQERTDNVHELLEGNWRQEGNEWPDIIKTSVSRATSQRDSSMLLRILGAAMSGIMLIGNSCSIGRWLRGRPREQWISDSPFESTEGLPIKTIVNVHENRVSLLNNHVDVSLIGSNSNLLLWDFFIRWAFGAKGNKIVSNSSNAVHKEYLKDEFANRLAYRHYVQN